MTRIQPQTVANDLIEEISEFADVRHLDDQVVNFRLKALEKKCEDLIKVDPGVGYIVRARLYMLFGNVNEVMSCYRIASDYSLDITSEVNYIYALMKLGLYKESKKHILQFADPKLGYFSEVCDVLVILGAYRLLKEIYLEIAQLKLGTPDQLHIESISVITDILEKKNIQDDVLVDYLDLSGEVMRKNRVFPSDITTVEVIEIDGTNLLHTDVYVNLAPDDVADLNMQLMELIVERNMPHAESILVSFRVKNEHLMS